MVTDGGLALVELLAQGPDVFLSFGEHQREQPAFVHAFESASGQSVLDLACRSELEELVASDDVVLPAREHEQAPIEVDAAWTPRADGFFGRA